MRLFPRDLLTYALLLGATAPAHANGDDTPFTNLIALVSQRLALAEPVVRYKWARRVTNRSPMNRAKPRS